MKMKDFMLIVLAGCALGSIPLSAQPFPLTKDKLDGVNVSLSVFNTSLTPTISLAASEKKLRNSMSPMRTWD